MTGSATELCEAQHNSVAIPCVEYIMRGLAMAAAQRG